MFGVSSPSPWGFQAGPTPSYVGTANPFDIAGISADITRAASSLKPEEHGALMVKLDKTSGFGVGGVLRLSLPGDPLFMATVTRPLAGDWGWSVSGRVSFLIGSEGAAPQEQKPVRIAPRIRGLYRLFRSSGNGKLKAAVKAVQASSGVEVELHG